MRVLVTTDAFPPDCGGSGWSAYELVKGLGSRGHDVAVVQPTFQHGTGLASRNYGGVKVLEFRRRVPNVPLVRAYLTHERLGASLGRYLRGLIRDQRIELVHAQHTLTALPSIEAGRATGVPVLCTVRDYWPVCYWGDLRFDARGDTACPECSVAMMTKCIRPRSGRLWPLALAVIPYMRHSLAVKQRVLRRADVVIGVSRSVTRDLQSRSHELAHARVETIPNMVDVKALGRQVAATPHPLDTPYAVYVGKLAANKGSGLLPDVIRRAKLSWPLVVIGDGPGRASLEAASAQLETGCTVHGVASPRISVAVGRARKSAHLSVKLAGAAQSGPSRSLCDGRTHCRHEHRWNR